MSKYHVYVDWTTEDSPRPYYVGKGTGDRVENPYRGEKHEGVRRELGFDRRVVFQTDDEVKAFDKEAELIEVLRTAESKIGCNVSLGHNGVKGVVRTKGIHLKLPGDVHSGLKLYATKNRTTMQALLEEHATRLARSLRG